MIKFIFFILISLIEFIIISFSFNGIELLITSVLSFIKNFITYISKYAFLENFFHTSEMFNFSICGSSLKRLVMPSQISLFCFFLSVSFILTSKLFSLIFSINSLSKNSFTSVKSKSVNVTSYPFSSKSFNKFLRKLLSHSPLFLLWDTYNTFSVSISKSTITQSISNTQDFLALLIYDIHLELI